MPHLQYEFNRPLDDADCERLTDWTTIEYAEVMDTGTDHVAVSVRQHPSHGVSLGRATNGDAVVVLDADVREGRTFGQRERFADAVIDTLDDWFDVDPGNCYVVYTEHPGEDFFLAGDSLEPWTPGESE